MCGLWGCEPSIRLFHMHYMHIEKAAIKKLLNKRPNTQIIEQIWLDRRYGNRGTNGDSRVIPATWLPRQWHAFQLSYHKSLWNTKKQIHLQFFHQINSLRGNYSLLTLWQPSHHLIILSSRRCCVSIKNNANWKLILMSVVFSFVGKFKYFPYGIFLSRDFSSIFRSFRLHLAHFRC